MDSNELEQYRMDLWSYAFDDAAGRIPAKNIAGYANTKLQEFDKQFLPQTYIEELILVEKEITMDEVYKSAMDVRYFIETYCGKHLTTIQYKILDQCINDNNKQGVEVYDRQDGTTTILALYALHQALFNSYFNIVLIGNKRRDSLMLMDIAREAYFDLPEIFKNDDLVVNNKYEMKFSNGSSLMGVSSSPENLRGYSLNLAILDNVEDKSRYPLQEVLAWSSQKTLAVKTSEAHKSYKNN